MARLVANATGNFTASATWDTGVNTPTIHASTNITISSGGINSATFTAPNTTNFSTGALIFIPAIGSAGTITATLQESGVDKASASIAVTALQANTWVYFRWATPYQYTTTGAGAYRIKLANAAGTGTTSAAADSGGSNFAYLATDDRHSAPVASDDVFIVAPNQGSAITITVDANATFGSGTATGAPTANGRVIGNALYLYNNGTLDFSRVASTTLTVKGIIEIGKGGYFYMGTVASPIPTPYVATLALDQNGVTANYPIQCENIGHFILQGNAYPSTTLYKTTYSSGLGTAASPLITATAVDWTVGDEIVVTGSAYNTFEKKFIKTKNSSTSYVLSDTAGGVEAAFVNARTTNHRIFNLSRTVVIKSTNASFGWCFIGKSQVTGDINIDWSRFEYLGGTASGLRGLQVVSSSTSDKASCDYSIIYVPNELGFVLDTSKQALTFTGLISYGQVGATNTGTFAMYTTPNNKTFVDCFAVGNERIGFALTSGVNFTFTGCEAWNCNSDNNGNAGGWVATNSVSCTWNSCHTHGNRANGFVASGIVACTFNSYNTGTYGDNTVDFFAISNFYNDCVFKSSLFASTTLVSNYLSQVPGSKIAFHEYQQTTNNHRWYTAYGSAQSTGAALSDTTVRTNGSLGLRIAPEDSTDGFQWEFKILARAASAVSILGFIKKNAAFGTDAATVSLFLPGSTTADATTTMGNDTNWNVFNLAASYVGTVDAYATVRITAKTVTGSAYIYVDDLYNGTNQITGLDVWDSGLPSPIMFEELGDASAVWAVLTSTLTTPGTTGFALAHALTTAKFLALK